MRHIIVIAHDIRSTHNVGSLLRTAEGLRVEKIYFTGYTPYPAIHNDERLPHIAQKLSKQIDKTALGAGNMVDWEHAAQIKPVIDHLRAEGFRIVGLEQTPDAIELPVYNVPDKIVIILGREVEGIEPTILATCDDTVVIPMFGRKESFNVVQAAAMMLYHCRFSRDLCSEPH